MARIYADIPKFKRIEAALREVAGAQQRAIADLDKALSARRTEQEAGTLGQLRERCRTMRQESIDLLLWFHDQIAAG